MGRIYVAGTADTKGAELAFLAARVVDAGGAPLVVDLGTRAAAVPADIPAAEVAAHHPAGAPVLGGDDRGAAVTAMGEAFAAFVRSRDDIAGIVGIGGGGGTSIVTAGMRALPFGLPEADGLDPRLRRRRPLRRRLRHHHDALGRRHRRPQPHHPHRARPGRPRRRRHDPRPGRRRRPPGASA